MPTSDFSRTFAVSRIDSSLPKERLLTHCRRDGYGSSVVSSNQAGELQRGTIESAPFLNGMDVGPVRWAGR
jgi:hypothetical protein